MHFKIQLRIICHENENKSDFKMTISFVRFHQKFKGERKVFYQTVIIRRLSFCIIMTDKYKMNSGLFEVYLG